MKDLTYRDLPVDWNSNEQQTNGACETNEAAANNNNTNNNDNSNYTHVFDGGVSANAGFIAQRLSVGGAVDLNNELKWMKISETNIQFPPLIKLNNKLINALTIGNKLGGAALKLLHQLVPIGLHFFTVASPRR